MIYFIGVSALIIFSIVMFPKQVRISLIRLRYGRYSYRYVKLYKKYANKSPHPYCFKDDIMPYLRLSFYKKENIEIYHSDHLIRFEDLPYRLPLQEIIDKYGNPACFNAFLIKNRELRAYGYYKTYMGIKAKAVFFFMDKLFVMGEYIVDDLSSIDIKSFSERLLDQYNVKALSNSLHFHIRGQDQTSLYFNENGFTALIRFTDLTNEDFNKLIG